MRAAFLVARWGGWGVWPGSALLSLLACGAPSNSSDSAVSAGTAVPAPSGPDTSGPDGAALESPSQGAASVEQSPPGNDISASAPPTAGISGPPADPNVPMGGSDNVPAQQDDPADGDALAALTAYLEQPVADRPPLEAQPFVDMPLSKQGIDEAEALLWADYAAQVRAERADEFGDQRVVVDGIEMHYLSAEFGAAPEGQRALFISMHGGGATAAATNDGQWRNQLALGAQYGPEDAIWVAPRAPTDDWNMWFKDHIPGLFDRLITNFAVFAGVDTDRVYLSGYSAGGDGVYQLGPRMADRWAGAAMSAGHPNDASPLNLRNVPFAIHVGENDRAFDRNRVAQEWADQLSTLHADDPMGYIYQLGIHAGLGHWMELQDAVSIPFLQMHPRTTYPTRVVFRQDGELQPRLYNLRVDTGDVRKGSTIVIEMEGQQAQLLQLEAVPRFRLRLNDTLMNLDQPVQVIFQGRTLVDATIPRTIATLHQSLVERGDPGQMFSAEIEVEAPNPTL